MHFLIIIVCNACVVQAPIARPSLDVWALGVLLYEVDPIAPLLTLVLRENRIVSDAEPFTLVLIQICSSQHLFERNFTNDNISDAGAERRLCTWHTMSDEQLEGVEEALAHKGTRWARGYGGLLCDCGCHVIIIATMPVQAPQMPPSMS